MFFMIGISDGRKDIAYAGRLMSCPGCGQTGSCSVFMTYTVLLLFFIPCFKWNRRYFVRTSCCNRTYELSFEKGDAIRRGDDSDIYASDLFPVQDYGSNGAYMNLKHCDNCGYENAEDFDFCPKCGKPF